MTTDSHIEEAPTAGAPSPAAAGPSLIDCRGDYPVDKVLASVDELPSGWYIVNFKENTWLLYKDRAEISENLLMVGSYADERVLWLDDKNPVNS